MRFSYIGLAVVLVSFWSIPDHFSSLSLADANQVVGAACTGNGKNGGSLKCEDMTTCNGPFKACEAYATCPAASDYVGSNIYTADCTGSASSAYYCNAGSLEACVERWNCVYEEMIGCSQSTLLSEVCSPIFCDELIND